MLTLNLGSESSGVRIEKSEHVRAYSRDLAADVAANSGEYEKNQRTKAGLLLNLNKDVLTSCYLPHKRSLGGRSIVITQSTIQSYDKI